MTRKFPDDANKYGQALQKAHQNGFASIVDGAEVEKIADGVKKLQKYWIEYSIQNMLTTLKGFPPQAQGRAGPIPSAGSTISGGGTGN